MPRVKGTYTVREDPHEKFIFWVESWSDPENPYKVNLIANEGNGYCGCMDFQTRCFKNWKDNGNQIVDYGQSGRPNPKRTICRHIKYARWKFLNKLLKVLHDENLGNI